MCQVKSPRNSKARPGLMVSLLMQLLSLVAGRQCRALLSSLPASSITSPINSLTSSCTLSFSRPERFLSAATGLTNRNWISMAHQLCRRCQQLSFKLHLRADCESLSCKVSDDTYVHLHSELVLHSSSMGELDAPTSPGRILRAITQTEHHHNTLIAGGTYTELLTILPKGAPITHVAER
jgi:hypothetical protein